MARRHRFKDIITILTVLKRSIESVNYEDPSYGRAYATRVLVHPYLNSCPLGCSDSTADKHMQALQQDPRLQQDHKGDSGLPGRLSPV